MKQGSDRLLLGLCNSPISQQLLILRIALGESEFKLVVATENPFGHHCGAATNPPSLARSLALWLPPPGKKLREVTREKL